MSAVACAMLAASPIVAEYGFPDEARGFVQPPPGVPVPVRLAVNEEMRLHFGETVELGLPVELTQTLNASSVHGVLYLNTAQSIEPTRVAVKGTRSGKFTLLDISASHAAQPLRDLHFNVLGNQGRRHLVETKELSAAQVLRFVAQQTLLPNPPAQELNGLSLCRNSAAIAFRYQSETVTSTVLSVWRSKRWLALAVELKNRHSVTHEFDPLLVKGDWQAVAFRDVRLLPNGKRGSKSVAFVVGTQAALSRAVD